MMKRLVFVLGMLVGIAHAQTFPSRPVRILVPAPPGSSPDIRARQIAPKLQEALGQPFIVENRPGGGGAGLIAAREVARAAPDGHTLLLALINSAIFDALSPDPCCRLNQELMPISRFTMTPLVAVINPSVPASSLKELISLGKGKTGLDHLRLRRSGQQQPARRQLDRVRDRHQDARGSRTRA